MGLNPRVPVKMSEIRSPEGVIFFWKNCCHFLPCNIIFFILTYIVDLHSSLISYTKKKGVHRPRFIDIDV